MRDKRKDKTAHDGFEGQKAFEPGQIATFSGTIPPLARHTCDLKMQSIMTVLSEGGRWAT
jgi:hypothetical protein